LADAVPERFLAVARLVRPQGRKGEVVADLLTDFAPRFQNVRRVFLETPGQAPQPIAVENTWNHKGRVVIKFSGIDSIDAASLLRDRLVLIPLAERMPLPANQYYLWELEGCRVVREEGGAQVEVGMVSEVESTGGVGVLHVTTSAGEVLIPLAQEICTRIDTQDRTILIDPPEDLLDLNA
jgi:16S rRNA processing protein RimM